MKTKVVIIYILRRKAIISVVISLVLFLFPFLLVFVFFVFYTIAGVPAVTVVLSLSIAAGMDGIESFVSEE